MGGVRCLGLSPKKNFFLGAFSYKTWGSLLKIDLIASIPSKKPTAVHIRVIVSKLFVSLRGWVKWCFFSQYRYDNIFDLL